MALPESAVSALTEDLPSKGFGAPKAAPSLPDSPDGEKDVVHEIAGDVIDAIQAGSRDDAVKFLMELMERMTGSGAPEPPASSPEMPES